MLYMDVCKISIKRIQISKKLAKNVYGSAILQGNDMEFLFACLIRFVEFLHQNPQIFDSKQ